LTIVLDIDPAQSLKRISGKKDRLESEALEFHRKVREGFLKLSEIYPDRIKVVDASQSPHEIFKTILFELKKSGIITL